MPGQRRDYILHQIDLLRQFVARIVGGQSNAGLDDMLQLSFGVQEKLFGMPPTEFLPKEVSEQVALLQANETPAVGREKCLTYARLLTETAALYEHRGRNDLADGARQLALHVTLCVAQPNAAPDDASRLVEALSAQLDPAQLHAPVAELLQTFQASK